MGSTFNEKVQVDFLCSNLQVSPFYEEANVAPFTGFWAMSLPSTRYLYPEYSLVVRVCPKNLLRVWGAFLGSRISVPGRIRAIQMDAGGE